MNVNELRFPKIKSPFERSENEDGEYTTDDEVMDGYGWVFNNRHTTAIEKLDGTSCAVSVEHTETGDDIEAYTRFGPEGFQRADPFGSTPHQRIVQAFQNSIQRGYIPDEEGVHYGECVGPSFQGNPHELDERLFIPFSWLADKCAYKSWNDPKYGKGHDDISAWFEEGLFSLFASRMKGIDLKEASVANGTFCEGIIVAHPDASYKASEIETEMEHLGSGTYRQVAPNFAKIRRDMFDWFEGERH
jgi:hypothetical protein